MTIRPIRTSEDLAYAKQRLEKLMLDNRAGMFDDEIEVIATLVEQFERNNSRLDAPNPIAAIRFRMDEAGLSARQLEPFIGSRARVSEVLSGKRQLSIDMIRSLHEGLGIPYESLISERPRYPGSQNSAIPNSPHLLHFDSDPKPREEEPFQRHDLQSKHAHALLRKTRTQRAASKTDQAALLRWQEAVLRTRTIAAGCKFDHSKFTAVDLRGIAKLSAKTDGPKRAIAALASLGISVVILPPFQGTFLDGAAMLDTSGTPVIGLTLRHDRVDSFWFTLMHELAHILLHYKILLQETTGFIDDLEIRGEDTFEREADQQARDSLVPPHVLSQITWGNMTSQDDVVAAASRARVHISVVAGRWQRDHQNYKKFARLIERDTVRLILSAT